MSVAVVSRVSAPSKIPLPDFLPQPAVEYLDELEAAGRTPQTLALYRNVLRGYFAHLAGKVATPADVRDHLDSILNPNSRSLHLVILRQFYKFQKRRGWMTDDPTAGIPRPKKHRREYGQLDVHAFNKALGYLPPSYRMIALVLYYTGARITETCTLRVEDVSFQDEQYGTIEFRSRKGGNAGFAVFGPEIAEALRTWIDGREGYLFPSPFSDARPVLPKTVWDRLRRAGELAGIPGRLHPHRLRHSYICTAVESGAWNQLALQQQLGHRNAESTAHYYKPSRRGLQNILRTLHGQAVVTVPAPVAPMPVPVVTAPLMEAPRTESVVMPRRSRADTRQSFHRFLLDLDPEGEVIRLGDIADRLAIDAARVTHLLNEVRIPGWVRTQRRYGKTWLQVVNRDAVARCVNQNGGGE